MRNYLAFCLLQSKSIDNDDCKNFSFKQFKNLLYLFYHPTLQYTKTPNINDSIFLTLLLNILSSFFLYYFLFSLSLSVFLFSKVYTKINHSVIAKTTTTTKTSTSTTNNPHLTTQPQPPTTTQPKKKKPITAKYALPPQDQLTNKSQS